MARKDMGSLLSAFSMEDEPDFLKSVETSVPKTKGKAIRKSVNPSLLVPNRFNKYNMEKDDEYFELLEGIKKDGLLSPIIVKPEDENGNYEIYSGHRRRMAALELGLDKVTVEVRDEEYKASEQIAFIGRGNSGARQKFPYDNALQIKIYYEALQQEGSYTKAEMKKKAIDDFGISERSLYNYDALSSLPEHILKCGQAGLISRDEGILLANSYQKETYTKITENMFNSLMAVSEDSSLSDKEKKDSVKKLFIDFDKAIKRKNSAEEKKELEGKNKQVKLYATVKKIDKLFVEEFEMPTSKKDIENTNLIIEKTIARLQELKEQLNK